ncbi:thiopeptide-type bacteriocin biosynthesis protein [Acrocarpospora sp. B8E8]|uniref:thiopeptide-type bacteriocin biosynthesis protein n=1 Tax=Acrocarpospora sp. B8E8 TaxID=3153572 RepID=UPI00325F350A
MPADQLTDAGEAGNSTLIHHGAAAAEATERAILKVLTGTPVEEAADGVEPAELASAVEIYQQAGRQALADHATGGWWQLYVQFTDWDACEQVAADYLAPLLHRAEIDGLIVAWWFMRKHPCWRLRVRPGPAGHTMKASLGTALNELAATGQIHRWWPGIYEAESAAFGGDAGVTAAHKLFDADSHAVMALLRGIEKGLGRRELSLLLCGILMRAAGLERYEEGDVWHRVALERPLPTDVPPRRLTEMADSLTTLMFADTTPDGALLGADGPVASAAGWADAFRRAGRDLGTQARAGTLQRGLREILSYHIIFHWNRLGLPSRTQSILAWSARAAILGLHNPPADDRPTGRPAAIPSAPPATETSPDLSRAVARFPLVRQTRLGCPDLATRVRDVHDYATSCHQPAEPEDRIDRACTAWNLAALIAADCAMPALAVELCERQFRLFQAAWPVSGRTAIASLQPLVNLARLDIRAGAPEGAYRALDQIYHAVHHGGSADIHGMSISFDGFTAGNADRAKVSPWLWDLLLQDGTRALVAAGQWAKAATHAARYDHAAEQLRESRQADIITRVLDGRIHSALALIDDTVTTQPWEQAVAGCLRTFARLKAAGPAPEDLTRTLAAVRLARQQPDRKTTLFRIRLGLTAVDLAAGPYQVQADPLCAEMIEEAEQSGDAYVAREVLGHPACRTRMTSGQRRDLIALVERAGLGQGTIPQLLLADLAASVEAAGAVLAQALGVPPPQQCR